MYTEYERLVGIIASLRHSVRLIFKKSKLACLTFPNSNMQTLSVPALRAAASSVSLWYFFLPTSRCRVMPVFCRSAIMLLLPIALGW